MDKNLILMGLMGVLLVVLVFQATALMSLNQQIDGAKLEVQKASAPVKAASSSSDSGSGTGSKSGAALPTNLQNLPSMVGGC